MIGTKRKEKMTKILSIFLLIFLVNCTTTPSTDKTPKSPVDNVIDVFKSIPFPTRQLTFNSNCDIIKLYETESYKQITTKTYR